MELTEYEERRPRLAPLGSGSASASRAGLAGFLVIAKDILRHRTWATGEPRAHFQSYSSVG